MVDSHIRGFFGHNTGIIIKSISRSNSYIIFQIIKKKPNGIWEKPSAKEGKIVKFALEEIILILRVLNREKKNWITYHSYKKKTTQISFTWEDKKSDILWINIDNYSKMLNYASIEILRLLLLHLVNEKIIYSTSANKSGTNTPKNNMYHNIENNNSEISKYYEQIPIKLSKDKVEGKLKKNITPIEGIIKKESAKAFLINFISGREIWIPKSTIHSLYHPRKNILQTFSIENWILRKHHIHSK